MAIPSQARKHFREGVETRRAAPKPHVRNGEGIVQTTNPPLAGRRKPRWYENPQARKSCEGSSPSARTRICYRAGQDGTILAYCYRRTGAAPAPFSPADGRERYYRHNRGQRRSRTDRESIPKPSSPEPLAEAGAEKVSALH